MVHANELRIGNLMERDGNILEVIRITKDGIINYKLVKKSQGMRVNNGNVIPISLTKEWLLRLGFEWYELLRHYRIVINDVWYQIKIDKDSGFIFSFINLNWDESQQMPPKIIKYVHKLQNLFFELSGKELILK